MKRLIFLFLCISNISYASFDMSERMQEIYTHIINLEFTSAVKLLDVEKTENPDNGLILMHENYIDFLTIIIGEDLDYYMSKESYKSDRISSIKRNNKDSPYYLYVQAEIYLQWAFIYLKFENYKKAIHAFIKSYSLLNKNQEIYPEFVLNKKGLGIIYSIIGLVPSEFQWILDLAGVKGGVKVGLNEIDFILNDSSTQLYANEMLFLVSFLQLNLINDNLMNQQYLDRIGDGYSQNLLLNFSAARISNKLGLNQKCINILESRPKGSDKFSFYYLDYLLGLSRLYELNYSEAYKCLNRFVENYRGVSYIKSAYQKLAWISYLENNKEEMYNNFLKTRKHGGNLLDVDKKAEKDAIGNIVSHNSLLKSRLLYDGGYYDRALEEIKQIKNVNNLSNSQDKIEYWYRLARIIEKLNFPVEDITNAYQLAYDLGRLTTTYFAPMSALRMALLYEDKNDLETAKVFFRKCLGISGFDYQRGIHQKARVGLSRINN